MTIITALDDFINMQKDKIKYWAMITRFKQREGNLEAITFLLVFTVCLHKLNEITLDLLASKCEEIQDELTLTKQALFQKLDCGAQFLKEVYLEVFSQQTKARFAFKHIEVLEQFTDVKFTDGTTVSLPDKLESIYKGMGGRNSKSAIKIQATYSLFNQKFTDMKVVSATNNDCSYNKEILESICENELRINDLGYFDKKYFASVKKKNAFYISRTKKNTIMYELVNGKYEEINIEKLLNNGEMTIDKEVYFKIDDNNMENIRLVGHKLPEEKINEKKRKANKKAKQQGKILSQKEKLLLEWFLVITNVSVDMLTLETICELYRLRWQIELSFKALKSGLDFDTFSNCGESYFKCLLYGKLIFILLTMDVFSKVRVACYIKVGRLVSIQRFLKNIRGRIESILNVFLNPCTETYNVLIKAIVSVSKRSLFEKRKRKTTEYELMEHDFPINYMQLSVCSNY